MHSPSRHPNSLLKHCWKNAHSIHVCRPVCGLVCLLARQSACLTVRLIVSVFMSLYNFDWLCLCNSTEQFKNLTNFYGTFHISDLEFQKLFFWVYHVEIKAFKVISYKKTKWNDSHYWSDRVERSFGSFLLPCKQNKNPKVVDQSVTSAVPAEKPHSVGSHNTKKFILF